MRRTLAPLAVAACALVIPASAYGHAERSSYYPNFNPATETFGAPFGHVPAYRRTGRKLVVCKSDSRRRIIRTTRVRQGNVVSLSHRSSQSRSRRGRTRYSYRRSKRGRFLRRVRRKNLTLLERCDFRHIQAAVNAASSNTRILVLPGVYREEPSRSVPDPDPRCENDYEESGSPLVGGLAGGEGGRTPNYEYHRKCQNSQNLIAVMGDGPDADRRCDRKCNIQIEGTGRRPQDVVIRGNREKLNVIRADRADGVVLRNFLVEFSDFNNIYALETNGFRFEKIISRWSREYGFLSFTSDHGLYNGLRAYGSGDSGIYPGSGPEGHCSRYGIEIKNSNSFGNTIGYSGTAGNGVYAHHNRFHHNATGMTTDSFAPNHPGMPQDCAKWEQNRVYSNNLDLFNDSRDAYCKRPPRERNPKIVCPTFQVPIGTGILIGGGNRNIVRRNWIYDNWRQGTMLFSVPAPLRGDDPTGQSDNDPSDPFDTSHGNRHTGNRMSVTPSGRRDPNGVDFWWDEEGTRNCWSGNTGPGGSRPTGDPPNLPACPGSAIFTPANPEKLALLAPCATWDPQENTDPPGCSTRGYSWFERPPEPR